MLAKTVKKFFLRRSGFWKKFLEIGVTGAFTLFIAFGMAQAGTIVVPTGTPTAQFYTLSEIYNLIASNATTSEGGHAFTFSDNLAGSGRTLTEIYDALTSLIDPTKVLAGTTYLGTAGTLTNNGAFSLSASSTDQSITAGYYSGGTLTGDADLVARNIKSGTTIFGVLGTASNWTYGDNDAAKVLTTASAPGTYSVSALSDAVVRKGIGYGVNVTGTYSGYPGSGWSGSGLTQTACESAAPNWYWFEDTNGDGDTTDPIDGLCVQAAAVTSTSWNGGEQVAPTPITNQSASGGSSNTIFNGIANWTDNAYANAVIKITSGTGSPCWGIVKSNTTSTVTLYGSWLSTVYIASCSVPDSTSRFTIDDDFGANDGSWIGDWTCSGSFPNGTVSWGSFPTEAQVGSGAVALATADCLDGTRDLLPTESSRSVKSGTATAADATSITDSSLDMDWNVWVGQKVLITGGTGAGGWGRIESNATTTITVNGWTGGTPGVGSSFSIVYLIPHAWYNNSVRIDGDNSDEWGGSKGPLNNVVMNEWRGTKLASKSDYYGICSSGGTNVSGQYETSCSSSKTVGGYGGQNGRTDECIDTAHNYEYLLGINYFGFDPNTANATRACSQMEFGYPFTDTAFRTVFRP